MPSVTIQVSAEVLERATVEAVEAGFETFARKLEADVAADYGGLPKGFFTPSRLAELDDAVEQVRAGRFVTWEEFESRIAARREAASRDRSR